MVIIARGRLIGCVPPWPRRAAVDGRPTVHCCSRCRCCRAAIGCGCRRSTASRVVPSSASWLQSAWPCRIPPKRLRAANSAPTNVRR